MQKLNAAWLAIAVPPENIVEDFISILPRFEFEIDRKLDRQAAVEKKVGYLMQMNLHVSVESDAKAMEVIASACDNDVPDIIAFDYWSRELDQIKLQARGNAIKAAREKSELLLAIFQNSPA